MSDGVVCDEVMASPGVHKMVLSEGWFVVVVILGLTVLGFCIMYWLFWDSHKWDEDDGDDE